jgi:hypothetical protein
MQTAEIPITASSYTDPAIVAAGIQRAAFWGYPPDSVYTVSVLLPPATPHSAQREVRVSRDQAGQFTIR